MNLQEKVDYLAKHYIVYWNKNGVRFVRKAQE